MPWDEPWVRALKLTKPMFVVLFSANAPSGQINRALYPGGQMRLIMHGLYRRGLIDERFEPTMCGRVAAVWAHCGVARVWPDAEDNP
jgi:hypothetical protein